MNQLVNIFLEPSKVFNELNEKPNFWLPIVLIAVSSAVMVLWYFQVVDSEFFMDQTLAQSGREMTAAEIAQAKQFMPGTAVMGYFGAGAALIFTPIMFLVFGVYVFLASKVTGQAHSFKKSMSLVSWSSMPSLIGVVIACIGIAMMNPQTMLDSLMLTKIDPLLVNLPFDHAYKTLAKSLDLIMFWTVFLLALGWKNWGKTSWTQAITVAALPSVGIFGGMLVWALLK